MNDDDDDDDDAATMIAPRSAMPFALPPETKGPLPAAGTPAIAHAARPAAPALAPAVAAPTPGAPGWVRAYLWTCSALTLAGVGALVWMKLARMW